jgi:hypothetical protein
MRNTVAQLIRPVGIALMLATLMTSLIVRVPVTLAENQTGRADNPAVSNPWPVDDLASSRIIPSNTPPQSEASLRAQVNKAYGKLPLSFELNQGQTHREVKFLSRGPGYQLFLTQTEAVLAFKKPCSYCDEPAAKKSDNKSRTSEQERAVLRVKLVDANPAPQVTGLDELPGKSNYIKGNDRSHWQRNVPNYAKVRYSQVYAGVDMVYYGNQRQLEYDFIVAPFADPKPIEVAYEGGDHLALDKEGNLLLQVKGVRLTQQAPVVYQEAEGVRQTIASRYVLKDKRRVGFEIGAYDSSRPLVIDPLLVYSTYLGGSIPGPEQIGDFAAGIATDASGNAYIVGTTDSEDFPMVAVADPYSEEHRNDTCSVGDIDFLKCGDVFVTKLNADGSNMVYSTFIGSDHDDQAFGIAVDSSNRAYITGGTDPFSVFGTVKHWPLTSNAFQRDAQFDARDAADAFVTVLNSTGTDLVYSTYYGGNNIDIAHAIAIGPQGFAYITGETDSTRFITMRNAFQNDKLGDDSNRNQHRDAFVAVFNPFENRDNDTLIYATYFGGTGTADIGNGIAVDTDGNAHVVGQTNSTNFPTKVSEGTVFQAANGGGTDAWVAKFNTASSGSSSLIQSTYFGGNSTDIAFAVTVDSTKRIYLTGRTSSSNTTFPLNSAFDSIQSGGEAFVAKFGVNANALFYSTFLGGDSSEEGRGIVLDEVGNAYVAGKTASSNFPSVNAFQPTKSVANDAFVTKISADPAGTTQVKILWSSFLGGNDVDVANGIALDSKDNVYVAGETESAAAFPILGPNGAFQSALRGNNDAFATKIAETRGDTIGVFHPVGTPQFLLRNTNSGGAADQTVTFGENGDLPVAGDWDGNGIDDVGIFRPSAGQFLLRQFGFIRVCNPICTVTFGFTTVTVPFGQAGDLPIVGDWDGDGDDTVGVYRPSNTTFFLSNSNQNPQNNIISVFGVAEDLPVAGDWNADGVDTIGVFRPSVTTFFLSNTNENPQQNIISVFGQAADLPLAGDWDGDGDDNIGVFRPSAARFNLSNDNSAISFNFIFGTAGDQPVAGDWDGNP